MSVTRPRTGRRTARERDLLAMGALALACAAATWLTAVPPLRIAGGVLLELLLPGYAITALVSDRRALRAAELALGVIGASLVTAALGGLLLDVLPGHMGHVEWVALLLAVTLGAGALAIVRPPAAEPSPVEHERAPRFAGPRSPRAWANVVLAVLALAVVVAAVLVARHAANRQPGFVELSELPVSAQPGSDLAVTLRSHQPRPMHLLVVVSEDSTPVRRLALTLAPGREWHTHLPAPRPTTARVRVDVYRAGSGAAYLRTSYYRPAPLVAAARASGARIRAASARGAGSQARVSGSSGR
jgi:hypothetical protein